MNFRHLNSKLLKIFIKQSFDYWSKMKFILKTSKYVGDQHTE